MYKAEKHYTFLFDLGVGTSEFQILELFERVIEVKSIAGVNKAYTYSEESQYFYHKVYIFNHKKYILEKLKDIGKVFAFND